MALKGSMNKNITVAVGLSGGVDSSVTAYLLKEEGYNLVGITMKIWDGSFEVQENEKHACFGPGEEKDIDTAEALCRDIGIPYHVIDLAPEFSQIVLAYFRSEYLAGRTPNPCVRCNQSMKFGFMLDKARALGVGFDYFATGHYARLEKDANGRIQLKKAVDAGKDQTYFIAGLERSILEKTMFPLGGMMKSDVRTKARAFGLSVADAPESQDFMAGGDYTPLFLDGEAPEGDIVDVHGNVLGRHKGIIHYTIGQRRGLGVCSDRPMFVSSIDAAHNRIVIDGKDGMYSKGLRARLANLLSIDRIEGEMRIAAKIRQMHREAGATLSCEKDGMINIIFDNPQLAITPGQAVVMYDGDIIVGSGIIEEAVEYSS